MLFLSVPPPKRYVQKLLWTRLFAQKTRFPACYNGKLHKRTRRYYGSNVKRSVTEQKRKNEAFVRKFGVVSDNGGML